MTIAVTVLPWRHASELAFVRDCFYPHHASTALMGTDADIYAVATPVVGLVLDNDDDDEPRELPDFTSTTSATKTGPGRDMREYEAGLRRIGTWTFRSPRSVPHAVTATAGLVEARVHDEVGFCEGKRVIHFEGKAAGKGEGVAFRISETAVKSIYAMAFLKFVNGFVDRDVSRSARRTGLSRTVSSGGGDGEEEELDEPSSGAATAAMMVNKSMGESSMYAHAATIGMPSQFVDLRHRCVHGEVPELTVLRRMTGRALEWLWERWWKGNATGDAGRFRWEMEVQCGIGNGNVIEQSTQKGGSERTDVVMGGDE